MLAQPVCSLFPPLSSAPLGPAQPGQVGKKGEKISAFFPLQDDGRFNKKHDWRWVKSEIKKKNNNIKRGKRRVRERRAEEVEEVEGLGSLGRAERYSH